jgi:hypothetical protein
MGKVEYTEDHVRFILDNYIKNEAKCVKETGHSLSSIKLMLQNIGASYGFLNFSKGNPMYARIADEYRKKNPVFGEEMSTKSFCLRFGIIKN